METVAWSEMTWLNEPPSSHFDGDDLVVETGANTDFWRKTAYGFTHDDGHFLAPLDPPELLYHRYPVHFRHSVIRYKQIRRLLRTKI